MMIRAGGRRGLLRALLGGFALGAAASGRPTPVAGGGRHKRQRKRCRRRCKHNRQTCDSACRILDGDSRHLCEQGCRVAMSQCRGNC